MLNRHFKSLVLSGLLGILLCALTTMAAARWATVPRLAPAGTKKSVVYQFGCDPLWREQDMHEVRTGFGCQCATYQFNAPDADETMQTCEYGYPTRWFVVNFEEPGGLALIFAGLPGARPIPMGTLDTWCIGPANPHFSRGPLYRVKAWTFYPSRLVTSILFWTAISSCLCFGLPASRRLIRRRRRQCPHCAYPAIGERCPECGTRLQPDVSSSQ